MLQSVGENNHFSTLSGSSDIREQYATRNYHLSSRYDPESRGELRVLAGSGGFHPSKDLQMRHSIWIGLLLMCVPGSSLAQKNPTPAAKDSCGYPNYCARSDTKVEPYPKTPPDLPKAGSQGTDPVFGSRILRVTDGSTDPKKPGQQFQTPSSAQQNTWNTDSSKFYVKEAGGKIWVYDFDPSKMTAKIDPSYSTDWRGEPEFSYSNPNLIFGVAKGSVDLEQFDFSKNKVSTVHKPSDCVKLNPNDFGTDPSVSADDARFMVVIGPQQNANYLVYVYDRQKGCRWLNTKTGEIGGQWGPKGTISDPELRFGIHDARIAKSGDYVAIAGSQRGPVIWDVNSMNVTLCDGKPPMSCGGHHAMGYQHMINPSRRHHPMELLVRPLNDLSKVTPLVKDPPATEGWYDKHLSWNNVDKNDTYPACFSNYRDDNPITPATALKVVGPWENEINCVEMDGKGSKIWRFAHHYSTAKNGFWSTPRGNVSQDGRFFVFTSDWEDTLGKGPSGNYRSDVFVVELK